MTTLQSATEDRIAIHTVRNPAAGQTVEIAAGNRLDVRFTTGITSRWEIVRRPVNLVPLALGRASFSFLAFRTDVPVQELVLRRVGGRHGDDTRVLQVVTLA